MISAGPALVFGPAPPCGVYSKRYLPRKITSTLRFAAGSQTRSRHTPVTAEEIAGRIAVVKSLTDYLADDKGTVTLVFAAKDETHNNAEVLREQLS